MIEIDEETCTHNLSDQHQDCARPNSFRPEEHNWFKKEIKVSHFVVKSK